MHFEREVCTLRLRMWPVLVARREDMPYSSPQPFLQGKHEQHLWHRIPCSVMRRRQLPIIEVAWIGTTRLVAYESACAMQEVLRVLAWLPFCWFFL